MLERTRRVLAGHNLTYAQWSVLVAADTEPVPAGELLHRALVESRGRFPVEEAGRALDQCVRERWLVFRDAGQNGDQLLPGGAALSDNGAGLKRCVVEALRQC